MRATATAVADLPRPGQSGDYPVRVEVRDRQDQVVFDAEILMRVLPKIPPQ
jgi:hypothetical protein